MKYTLVSLLAVVIILFTACSHKSTAVQQPANNMTGNSFHKTQPPCIVYKTTADYSKNVAVGMNADRSVITSYPDVADVFVNGNYPYPVSLDNGYLLDVRGIGPDAAFLDWTYEAYHKLGKTPSVEELMKHMLDKNPLTEMYSCGDRSAYTDLPAAMNNLIHKGFENCKKLK